MRSCHAGSDGCFDLCLRAGLSLGYGDDGDFFGDFGFSSSGAYIDDDLADGMAFFEVGIGGTHIRQGEACRIK
ncbi:UNVERIFIED_CONTAM: hypothetical protein LK11_22385 [Mumia flava]